MRRHLALSVGFLFWNQVVCGAGLMMTASGELPLNIILHEKDAPGSPIPLTLVHQFVNVGDRYISYISLAELESKLTPLNEGTYFWLSPSGRCHSCRIDEPFFDGGLRWILTLENGSFSFHSSGRRKIFRYVNGLVTEEIREGVTIAYKNRAGFIQNVASNFSALNVNTDCRASRKVLITLASETVALTLNEWGSITECNVDGGPHSGRYLFSYKDEFLSEVSMPDATHRIRIGHCEWKGDFLRNNVYHPVVKEFDGISVEIVRDFLMIRGRMRLGESEEIASWTASREGDSYRVNSISGQLGLLIKDVDAYTVE